MAGKVMDLASLIKKGDYDSIKDFLDRIPNRIDKVAVVNAPSASGSTAIFGVCWDGRADLLELLIENGAKVRWANVKENTAMSMAIECDQVDCVQILLAHGAIANIKEVHEIRAKTGKKISPKIDEMIEKAQAIQNEQETTNNAKTSELALAVLAGKIEEVIQLVTAPPPVITQNHRTKQIEKGPISATNADGPYSAVASHLVLIVSFRDAVSSVSVQAITPAMIAAKINELDAEGQTVLFQAAARGYQDICKVLIDKGADLNFRDKVGKSALHMAIASNQYATVKFLLEMGANTTGVDMRQIRFWSMSNISTRVDNLLKKYPPKPLRTSKLKRSPIEGLTLKEFALQKKIFKFFDANQDGFISTDELRMRLNETKRGPVFEPRLIRQMIKVANSFNNSKGVSFEQFVEILAPMKGQKNVQRRNSLEL
jgi:ankyrin repeat protein